MQIRHLQMQMQRLTVREVRNDRTLDPERYDRRDTECTAPLFDCASALVCRRKGRFAFPPRILTLPIMPPHGVAGCRAQQAALGTAVGRTLVSGGPFGIGRRSVIPLLKVKRSRDDAGPAVT